MSAILLETKSVNIRKLRFLLFALLVIFWNMRKPLKRILPVAFIIWKQKLLMMRLSVLIGCCQGFQRPESGIGS